jgi:hypothetical protein
VRRKRGSPGKRFGRVRRLAKFPQGRGVKQVNVGILGLEACRPREEGFRLAEGACRAEQQPSEPVQGESGRETPGKCGRGIGQLRMTALLEQRDKPRQIALCRFG